MAHKTCTFANTMITKDVYKQTQVKTGWVWSNWSKATLKEMKISIQILSYTPKHILIIK